MSNVPSSSDSDPAIQQAAIERLERMADQARRFDLSGIQDRWDDRLEGLQKRINDALADTLGDDSQDYKDLRVAPFGAAMDTGFGDRLSQEELQEGLRAGIEKAVRSLNGAMKVLATRMEAPPAPPPAGKGKAAPAPKPSAAAPAAPAQAAIAAPTAAPIHAPTPAPTAAATAAPTPASTPAATAAPTPAPTVAPTPAPTPAPTAAPTPAPTPAPTAAPAPAPTPAPTNPPMSSRAPAPAPAAASGRRVAIVSAQDDAASQAVAAFVEQLGLEPVTPDAPVVSDDTTFLDRLEGVRGADYAIVLLQAADLGPASGATGIKPETLMEIGFLFGVLARRKVCFLVSGKAALAPELEGLVLVHARDEADLWRLLVARAMRKAGLEVDMNKAL